MSEKTRIDAGVPTRIDKTDGQTRIDQPVGVKAQDGAHILPSRLATQYRIVSAFQTMGAEADLYLVEHLADKKNHVLKLYRRSYNQKVWK